MSTTLKNNDVEALYGNVYRVPINLLTFAEGADAKQFRNPRNVLASMEGVKPRGLDVESMNELRNSIQAEGLRKSIEARWVENGKGKQLQIVDGERRTRCVKKLVSSKTNCFDPVSQSWKLAHELYEFIEVKIEELDDVAAYRRAVSANATGVQIGEAATIALVRDFRKEKWTDERILEVVQKSGTWLKETDALIGLDNDTFTALANDQINRSAALELAKIEDVAERLNTLSVAAKISQERLVTVRKRIEKEINAADSKAEVAEAEEVEAKLSGDSKSAKASAEKASRLAAKVANKKKEKAQLETNGVKVTSKDLHKAKSLRNRDVGGSGAIKPLTRAKIQKFWADPAAALVKAGGLDEEGEQVCEVEDAMLVKLLCKQMENGEEDLHKILRTHRKNLAKQAK